MSAAAIIARESSARRDLAVAWMNHGHALSHYHDPTSLANALQAYTQAIVLLRDLPALSSSNGPLGDNPAWANSLGAAWMNHGQLLHRIHGTTQADEALASFDAAVAVLRPLQSGENPWVRRNLAGTQVNRANLLLDLSRTSEAAGVAREALTLGLPHERTEPVDADLSLKARRALCDALGRLLVTPGADQEALAAEASDLVDDGLALSRHWVERGENKLHPLAVRLFRFGTQLYRLHQPHFLAEFIAENLPGADAELRVVALEAIDAALASRPPGFLTMGDPATERHLQTGRELAALRVRVTA